MTTNAQIKANRNNAKKSTGPRTEEDKSRVSKSALKHGLLARDTVLPGEDPAEFDRQLAALEADIQPANSLEFELVRQIADAQWRMRRLTRLETGFIAAAVDNTRRYMEKRRPDELRPGYDGETLLLGSAMLERTQALVHLARYDGHLSRRFFRAVKQLADLRRDERKSRETSSSANSYTATDSCPGRYVPVQAPPPIDGRARPRAHQHRLPGRPRNRLAHRAAEFKVGVKAPDSLVAHALSVPRRDSSRRLGAAQSKTTKQTQSRRTLVESTRSNDEPRSVDLAFEIRGLCSAPPPTDNASPSGAASRHRTGNQHSGHMKASDSFVAHAFLRAVSPFVATSSPLVAHALSVPWRHSWRHQVPLWRTLSACRVETPLDAWGRLNRKRRNKPNLAEPPCKQQLPGQLNRAPTAALPRSTAGYNLPFDNR